MAEEGKEKTKEGFRDRKDFLAGTMAQACNLSNLGGRDGEDGSSRPARAKNLLVYETPS
jgi:hypothetical protein